MKSALVCVKQRKSLSKNKLFYQNLRKLYLLTYYLNIGLKKVQSTLIFAEN
jgi:hypothetical protein